MNGISSGQMAASKFRLMPGIRSARIRDVFAGRYLGISDFHPRSHPLPKSVYQPAAAHSKVYIDLYMQLVDTEPRENRIRRCKWPDRLSNGRLLYRKIGADLLPFRPRLQTLEVVA